MPSPEIRFRPATPHDCEAILHHRRSMFRDMGNGTAAELDAMVETTRPWLRRALSDGSYRAYVAEDRNGKVVAGGGVLVSPWPARPGDPNSRRALILNVYVEPEFRRRGIAREIMLLITQWLRDDGFRTVFLHASDEGRPLYESMGFTPTNEMQLRLA